MDKKNIGLLHGLLFAVCVIVLVYSGEQVKTKDTGISSWLMRYAALISSLGIASLAISFIPATNSNKYMEEIYRRDQTINGLYQYKGVDLLDISRDTVNSIEYGGRQVGYLSALQDINNYWNRGLTCFSLLSLILSVIFFGIGVFVL